MDIDQLKLLITEGEGLTVEFKEKYSPKIDRDIVAFANTKGGQILLGVGDNGATVGETLTNKMKAEIVDLARKCEPSIDVRVAQVDRAVVVSIEEGHEKPYSCSAGSFRRLDAISQKMTQKEMYMILRESLDKTFEDVPRKDCGLEDVSLQKVEAFLLEAKTSYAVNKDNIDLPPIKWTQRRVGDNMKASFQMGGVQWQEKMGRKSSSTGISKFLRSRWSQRRGQSPKRDRAAIISAE